MVLAKIIISKIKVMERTFILHPEIKDTHINILNILKIQHGCNKITNNQSSNSRKIKITALQIRKTDRITPLKKCDQFKKFFLHFKN
jgi:hypothetical protein